MSVHDYYISAKTCCMVVRIHLDCNACCRKAQKIILKMKEIETHVIEKQQYKIIMCGRFRPSDVAVKLQKKMNRRVEIIEVEEFGGVAGSSGGNEHEDQYLRPMIHG